MQGGAACDAGGGGEGLAGGDGEDEAQRAGDARFLGCDIGVQISSIRVSEDAGTDTNGSWGGEGEQGRTADESFVAADDEAAYIPAQIAAAAGSRAAGGGGKIHCILTVTSCIIVADAVVVCGNEGTYRRTLQNVFVIDIIQET